MTTVQDIVAAAAGVRYEAYHVCTWRQIRCSWIRRVVRAATVVRFETSGRTRVIGVLSFRYSSK